MCNYDSYKVPTLKKKKIKKEDNSELMSKLPVMGLSR